MSGQWQAPLPTPRDYKLYPTEVQAAILDRFITDTAIAKAKADDDIIMRASSREQTTEMLKTLQQGAALEAQTNKLQAVQSSALVTFTIAMGLLCVAIIGWSAANGYDNAILPLSGVAISSLAAPLITALLGGRSRSKPPPSDTDPA